MTKAQLQSLVADLICELVDYGKDIDHLMHLLNYYGYNDDKIREYFGLERVKEGGQINE